MKNYLILLVFSFLVFGCSDESDTFTEVNKNITLETRGLEKVPICHKTNSTKNPELTLMVAPSAVESHLAHGDYVGDCGNCVNCIFCDIIDQYDFDDPWDKYSEFEDSWVEGEYTHITHSIKLEDRDIDAVDVEGNRLCGTFSQECDYGLLFVNKWTKIGPDGVEVNQSSSLQYFRNCGDNCQFGEILRVSVPEDNLTLVNIDYCIGILEEIVEGIGL